MYLDYHEDKTVDINSWVINGENDDDHNDMIYSKEIMKNMMHKNLVEGHKWLVKLEHFFSVRIIINTIKILGHKLQIIENEYFVNIIFFSKFYTLDIFMYI